MAYHTGAHSWRAAVRNRHAEKVSFGARPFRAPISKSRPGGSDLIFIPKEGRGLRLVRFVISVRLLHFLQKQGVEWLGDLHGKAFSKLARRRIGGAKTLGELQAIVRSVQRGHLPPEIAPNPALGRWESGCFFVPKGAHALSPFDLPTSVRLEGALRKKRVTRLGDLDGVPFSEFLGLRNCGKATVAELVHLLKRVATGQFQPAKKPFSWADAKDLVASLEAGLGQIPSRARTLVLLRLGGKGDAKITLKQAGSKWGLTRERVRQIVDLSLLALRREGGPKLLAQLKGVASLCQRMVCPLTGDLLALWLRKSRGTHKFPFPFYVRLAGEMNPEIPAWPKGQQPSPLQPARKDDLLSALEHVLSEKASAISLKTAFQMMCDASHRRALDPLRLLASLQHAKTVLVQFPRPDQPEVRLRLLPGVSAVAAVLRRSDVPLTIAEITSRAEARFGKGRVSWDARTLGSLLKPENGFCQLGPRTYGLGKHLRFPRKAWPSARRGVQRLLEREGRPFSTVEMLKLTRCDWRDQIDAYELAHVLRECGQFVDLGRLRFALPSRGARS